MLTTHTASKKDTKKLVAIRVSYEFWVRVRVTASRLGISIQAFCIEAIERHIARVEKKNGNGDTTARTVIEKLRKSSSTE